MIVAATAAMSVLMSVSMSMTVMMRMATAAVVFMLVPVMIFMAAAAAVFMLVLMMMFMAATAIMLVPVMMLMLMLVPVMMLMLMLVPVMMLVAAATAMLVCHSNPFPSVCQFPWAPLPDKRMPCILSLQNKRRSPVMRCCYAGLNFLSRSALLTTETELSAIAAPPSMGFMSGPPKR